MRTKGASDVVVFGTWEQKKEVDGIRTYGGYFKASRVFILPGEQDLIPLTMITCEGSFCDLNNNPH